MQEEERWGVPPCQQTSPPLDSIDLIIADLRSTIIYSCTVYHGPHSRRSKK